MEVINYHAKFSDNYNELVNENNQNIITLKQYLNFQTLND